MDFDNLIETHIDSRADITIAAQPVSIEDASSVGIFDQCEVRESIVGIRTNVRRGARIGNRVN